jgi:methyltransferase-like protein/2-polyprenyl-3-methyl-5-hydroxy-6-metoxy-1,4-benzoquinol methylase
MEETRVTSYDQVDYPSFPIYYTHPDRLATMATLFGMKPAPAEKCRVLELGCFDGVNLISLAVGLPQSEFVGVDLAGTAIARGNALIKDLELKNVTLRHLDMMEMAPDYGQFDYIIVHGIFAWVPQPVCDQILAICKNSLAPQGVAYISYNAMPGCHSRIMLREMVSFHNRDFRDPKQQMNQALVLLKLLSNSVINGAELHMQLVRGEYDRWSARAPEAFYHDELAEVFNPLYFHQFMDQARKHELQFLAEADYFDMIPHGFSVNAVEVLDRIKGDIVLREQYMDFMRGRQFRKTLLCHPDVSLNREIKPETLRSFYISTVAKTASSAPNFEPGFKETFESEQGGKIVTADPLARAMFWRLVEAGPERFAFPRLVEEVEQRAREQYGFIPKPDQDVPADIAEFIWISYGAGLLDLHRYVPPFVVKVSDKPLASPLARWQARRSNVVATLHHRTFKLANAIQRGLLALSDGKRDRAALRADLLEVFAAGILDWLDADGKVIKDMAIVGKAIDDEMENFLRTAGRSAVLMG